MKLSKPISSINPTEKDWDRAEGLQFKHNGRGTFNGNGAPWPENAETMAKLIKDPEKLVRRAKAVVAMYGTRSYQLWSHGQPAGTSNVWIPFVRALRDMGFSSDEINEISNYADPR